MQKEFFTTEWGQLFSDDPSPVLKKSCTPFPNTYKPFIKIPPHD
ncbi:hypothetical protein NEISICOT_00521 [Neisseria sicca ATCC 29256]|uniref:Uncharacterized protein n=1 Tax=Neisseria sicca ATCC 29256 TaxID=547045 RepID=C6M1Y3_NEISI|nr:hypothetical protein NEISICOT_00521 [Neisseria sicca ATCC 29256]